MKKLRHFFTAILIVLAFLGCASPAAPQEVGILTSKVSGMVSSGSWTFVSGFATTSSTDSTKWTIKLYSSQPVLNPQAPWTSGSYSDTQVPMVYFSIPKSTASSSYTITTFGSGQTTPPALGVYAYVNGFDFLSFDSGTLQITKVELDTGMILGGFKGQTSDGKSSLNGSFSIPMDPASQP